MTLLMGIDLIVSLRDNGDVAPDQIPEVLAWTARELVRATLGPAGLTNSLPSRAP